MLRPASTAPPTARHRPPGGEGNHGFWVRISRNTGTRTAPSDSVHELSLCGAIADVVTRHAGPRRVEVIHLRIGQLRQVVPDTLAFCWTLVSEGTDLAGSVLDVERVPARLRCRACNERFALDGTIAFVCPACKSLDVEVVAGEDFDVTALDLAEV
jgi:hydrogenase nickel incorporation protein HypA/HybF